MLRKLLATTVVLVAGYAIGVFFGYKAAVVDYVENNARNIEQAAAKMYPTVEQVSEEDLKDMDVDEILSYAQEESDDESRGFH